MPLSSFYQASRRWSTDGLHRLLYCDCMKLCSVEHDVVLLYKHLPAAISKSFESTVSVWYRISPSSSIIHICITARLFGRPRIFFRNRPAYPHGAYAHAPLKKLRDRSIDWWSDSSVLDILCVHITVKLQLHLEIFYLVLFRFTQVFAFSATAQPARGVFGLLCYDRLTLMSTFVTFSLVNDWCRFCSFGIKFLPSAVFGNLSQWGTWAPTALESTFPSTTDTLDLLLLQTVKRMLSGRFWARYEYSNHDFILACRWKPFFIVARNFQHYN